MVVATLIAMADADDTPIAISDNPQLFLDNFLIRDMENLERVIQNPDKHPGNPVIVPEHPWEKRILEIYGTVLYDNTRERFRCWYLGNEYKNGIPDNPEYLQTAEYYTCYAESEDGIHWTKPMVGRAPFGRHEKHNVVIEGTHGFCVLPTPDDPDPMKRYKGAGGASVGESPDGLVWTIRNWRDTIGKNDTSTCVVRWKGEYLAYVRAQVPDPDWPAVMRGIGLSVSKDFVEWTPKETVFKTDSEDGYPWTQPYGISVTPYGDVLIGILWLLHLDEVEGNNSLGTMDTQLVVSRDGRTWERVANRAPFLSPTAGTWDAGRVFPGTTMFRRNGKVWIYFTGVSTRHGEGWGEMGIGLATLPEDRFVGLRVRDGATSGTLETQVLAFEGNELLVNADVGEDGLAVELVDAEGNVLPGAARGRSHLIRHDALRYRVLWDDGDKKHSLGDLVQDGPVRIRFALAKGSLYAFQIIDQ